MDGWQHKKERQERYDEKRSEFLEKLGFRMLRFWNNEVNSNLDGVFLKIEEAINLTPTLSQEERGIRIKTTIQNLK